MRARALPPDASARRHVRAVVLTIACTCFALPFGRVQYVYEYVCAWVHGCVYASVHVSAYVLLRLPLSRPLAPPRLRSPLLPSPSLPSPAFSSPRPLFPWLASPLP
jgi:hypothetical protein